MSRTTDKRLRQSLLAAATAVALSSAAFAAPAVAADAGVANLATLQDGQPTDRFIVKYREGSEPQANLAKVQSSLDRVARTARTGNALALHQVRRIATGADVVRTDRKLDRVEAAALMRQIAADPNVEYVEVDQLLQPAFTPNDSLYANNQWHYYEAAGGIRADKAWDVSTGSGIVVAVLDTGITNHSDLNGNVVAGYDMISDAGIAGDGDGRDSDPSDPGDYSGGYNSSWHGTHVAGTIAAVTNNNKGVAGVAYNAKIQPVRVLGRGGGYTSDIADGIIWASGGSVSGVPANSNPAEVINMSLGGSGSCSSTTQSAINGAVSRGTTVVVAAGNSNANTSGFNPANCNNVIAVASTTRTGARSSFSNYGPLIDVAAPGSDIASTINNGTKAPSTEGYGTMSGTSMAAPHVAGVVALMQSAAAANGGVKTPAQIEAALKSTLRPFPVSIDKAIGNGIVDAKAAVDAMGGGGGNPPDPDPVGGTLTKGTPVTGLSAATGATVNYTFQVPAGATNLSFKMSGGSGDADMYIKRGTAPTDSSYDCRPWLSGNTETCTFASPTAGTYHVRLKAYQAFSGVSLVANYDTGSGGGNDNPQTYSNTTTYNIPNPGTIESPITVSGRSGNGLAATKVTLDIRHTYRGDLQIDLVAPDNSTYRIKNSSGSDSADNVIGYANVNLTSEAKNGTWKLRVRDMWSGDSGYIKSWSIDF
ncbi:S8 family serine peptidase [Lysobacter ciconiae]|uniref:S8 family serine peptidase n=1 Tax=Novilysobacter ciconiae TaxID=2781022 RepID=A0A7S6UG87_9GAMM|nr:S8 family serine peptidase [Lysobacter ciconiae]